MRVREPWAWAALGRVGGRRAQGGAGGAGRGARMGSVAESGRWGLWTVDSRVAALFFFAASARARGSYLQ